MSYLLTVDRITKKYGTYTALSEVSLQVPEGCIFGLLGPNGAGKTTLIRLINQIIQPDLGSIFFKGEPLQPKHTAWVGYLPEERGLYKSMKVGEQALYLAQLKGLSKAEAKRRLQQWFERLEISGWWNKKIQELSKGMAQKIQFIVTVLHEPKLLVFDEPFSGFDPINANLIKEEILRLKQEGATLIFSTHRMESVEELCDEIALIHQSKKIVDGKLTDIKRRYKENSYEVAIETDHRDALFNELAERWTVTPTHFKTLGDEWKVKIRLNPGDKPNEIWQRVVSKGGSITHFVEIIPTAHDIFIQTVKSSENHE